MAQLTPQDDYMKTALRLPKELHAQIQKSAAEAGRSMNAEIISRLEQSFGPAAADEPPRLYVLLDSNGYPLSWGEISEHLKAIRRVGDFNAIEMEVNVITPDMESSSSRNKKVADLANEYRKLGVSHAIKDA